MSISSEEIQLISKLLKEVQYGSISIILNEGKIVGVESMKKCALIQRTGVIGI